MPTFPVRPPTPAHAYALSVCVPGTATNTPVDVSDVTGSEDDAPHRLHLRTRRGASARQGAIAQLITLGCMQVRVAATWLKQHLAWTETKETPQAQPEPRHRL